MSNTKRINKMIPTAMNVADSKLKAADGRISKEFNGYISSFGASIVSAGLLPSVIFFSQKGESEGGREKLIPCIEAVLKKHGWENLKLIQKAKELYEADARADISRLTDSISDAAVALKLAIRTYPKSK